MIERRTIKTNLLQGSLILIAVWDLLFALFFLLNLSSLSQEWNLVINQPEDLLWRQLLGVFFLISFLNLYPTLFEPVVYRHQIWLWDFVRPLLIILFLYFGDTHVAVSQKINWISQQDFFAVMFWGYLGLMVINLIFLLLTRDEARVARESRRELPQGNI